MAAKSPKYAHRYRSGIFGYLMFCACGSMCGVHGGVSDETRAF